MHGRVLVKPGDEACVHKVGSFALLRGYHVVYVFTQLASSAR